MDRNIKVIRDSPTWLIYLQLATFATYLYGLSAALPLLRAELGVSQAVAGLHGTGMALGGIAGGLALPALTRRFGRRVVTWAGLTGMNAGVLLVVFGHALPFTLAGFTLAGCCGSTALYVMMAVLSDHHGQAGAAVISEANAVGVIAGIATTYAFSVVAESPAGWRPALFVPVASTLLLALLMGRIWVPSPSAAVPEGPGSGTMPEASDGRAPEASDGRAPYGWRFHIAGVVLLCCVAIEFAFNLWAAELLSQRTGLSPGLAATGLSAMLAGMAAGRFGGARLALRFAPGSVLLGSLGVTLAGWALFWAGTSAPVCYAGLALSGLGISVQFPMGLTRMIEVSGGRPDQASGAASIWAGVGSGSGPFVLGALGDGFGTHTAFLLAPALIAVAAGGAAASRTRS
ncbi:MFS transporter [Microbispora sp. SCL1-1]|uniref:MFS transporter n=1 Tax=unclassified Microbispora TaxID=2614687 RepID=UPI001157D472|nr:MULTISPECIES: MFS transporter [unclassified Microbispora]NJP28542.1 MFS transporter [Microbispora sp. CL1-1]TQS08225.1 MFS transporter [Microbispora sp. SCL1-1]